MVEPNKNVTQVNGDNISHSAVFCSHANELLELGHYAPCTIKSDFRRQSSREVILT